MVAQVTVENDPRVKIPKAATAASARADEIHKIAYRTEEAPPADADAPPATSEATPPANQPNPPEATPPPTPALPAETAADWKGRYDAMKGRHDALQGQLQNQASRIASLETMLATMSTPPANTAPANTKPTSATKRVKPEDIEEFGTDLIDVVQRAALDAILPLVDERVEKVRTDFRTDLSKVDTKATAAGREATVSAHQRLLDSLDKKLPNWRIINKHPKFLNWLNLTDPLSGAIRKNLLNDAVAQGNAERAATFYRAFIAEEGDPAPAVPPKTPPASTNGAGNGSGNGLEKYAAPGRPAASGSAVPPASPDKGEIITRAQITAFYQRKAQGHYTKEQAADLEAQIFAAQSEGRIR